MRISLEKCLFVGASLDKEFFIKSCFDLGVIEFISDKMPSDFSDEIKEGLKALRILKRNFEEREPSRDLDETYVSPSEEQLFLVSQVVNETIALDARQHALQEEIKTLDNEILRVNPLGEFVSADIKNLEQMTDMRVRFFYRKHRENNDCINDTDYIFHISCSRGFDYYLVLGNPEVTYKGFIEIEVPFSSRELYERVLLLKKEIIEISDRLLDLAVFYKAIARSLCHDYNEKSLKDVLEVGKTELNGGIFAMTGWVPQNKIDKVFALATTLGIYFEKIPLESTENPPVYLENHGAGRIGEDLILIYDTPDSKDFDPSSWVFFSFAIFFSMIINDAGYGLVFLFGAWMMKFKTRKQKIKASFKRFLRLSCFLGMGCIFWGVMTTSFFGVSFGATSVFKKISLTHALAVKKAAYFIKNKPPVYKELVQEFPMMSSVNNPNLFLTEVQSRSGSTEAKSIIYDMFLDNILMELSLFIGAVHIILGICRYRRFNPAALGWALFIVGSYLYFPVYLRVISLIHYVFGVPYLLGGQIGLVCMGAGISCAVVIALVRDRIKGLGEITQVIQVFSDVLSYLRIYALGLAGAMMGATFNKIGSNMPVIIGVFVILAGHCVNIILSLMGGIIHGLRLNFIEWYHYSFVGGGKLFRPLVKLMPPD